MTAVRTIAIGDIHGCSMALRTLLDAISPQPEDILIPLGDYVDRGPDSRGVLDRLVALVDCCTLIPLLGNHEIMLLDSFTDRNVQDFWRHCGGCETLESYGGSLAGIPPEHLAFLRGLNRYHETDTHLFVHANYDYQQPLSETSDDLLFWEHVNRDPRPHRSGKRAIVGHTPQGDGRVLDLGHLVCIDTYCFGGGWLSAMEVTSNRLWQANESGELREGSLDDE